jgi:N utilization substance protein A
MLTRAIASEEMLSDEKPAIDLLTMDGMEEALAYQLASKGVISMEDLAEQSVDELMELTGVDKDLAGKLIMTARVPWFESEESNSESAN